MNDRATTDRVALEEERDFLLGSLDDLDAERRAGDVGEEDYRTLHADYTARAAAVLRALEAADPDAEEVSTPDAGARPRSWRRVGVTVLGVALVAVVAGALVAQSSGRRGDGGLTGLDVESAFNRIDDCQSLEVDGEVDAALACYGDILESLPTNVPALTFRGWLRVRQGDLRAGLADLDTAIDVDDRASAPRVFRASARLRQGDAPGAVADLAAFFANDPSEEERRLADGFREVIVDAALDACIDGDVTGSLAPVSVLTCYRDVLTVDEDDATARIYLGWLLARTGADDGTALDHLDAGLAADPDLSAGYVFRAALRAHLGDVEGALADLDRFDELDTPPDQRAAAERVREAIEAGEDPLARR